MNEAFERVASYGLMPNMIFYLMEVYHMEAITGTSILSVWSALSNGLSIFGAFMADSYLGRFRVIALGSLSTLLVSLSFFYEWIERVSARVSAAKTAAAVCGGFSLWDFEEWVAEEGQSPRINPVCLCLVEDGLRFWRLGERVWLWFRDDGDDCAAVGERYRELTSHDFFRRVLLEIMIERVCEWELTFVGYVVLRESWEEKQTFRSISAG